MQSTNDSTVVSFVGQGIETIQRAFRGTFSAGATITPDAVYNGKPLREWLEALRSDIDKFLA